MIKLKNFCDKNNINYKIDVMNSGVKRLITSRDNYIFFQNRKNIHIEFLSNYESIGIYTASDYDAHKKYNEALMSIVDCFWTAKRAGKSNAESVKIQKAYAEKIGAFDIFVKIYV